MDQLQPPTNSDKLSGGSLVTRPSATRRSTRRETAWRERNPTSAIISPKEGMRPRRTENPRIASQEVASIRESTVYLWYSVQMFTVKKNSARREYVRPLYHCRRRESAGGPLSCLRAPRPARPQL